MTWMPINTAPKHEDLRVGNQGWGPMIWLRAGDQISKGHWRFERSGWDAAFEQSLTRPGRWEDGYDQPVAFVPIKWSKIDA